MSNSEKSNYAIGLDIGTNSVGWAVINENYSFARYHNQNMWGSRLFDAGEVAKGRRLFRSSRKRYERRRQRLNLLRTVLEEAIFLKDSTFFHRLADNFLYKEDRRNCNYYNLFNDKDYSDKDYYNQFPTIYHLRKYLINTTEKVDIRLIYLALHHIIKYRGNFIYEHQDFDISTIDFGGQIKSTLKSLEDCIYEEYLEKLDYDEITDILITKDKSIAEKRELLKKQFDKVFVDKKYSTEFINLIIGSGKVDLGHFLNINVLSKEEADLLKVSFKENDFEETRDSRDEILQDKAEIVEQINELYNMIILKQLFNGEDTKYISDIMVSKYNKHKKDLEVLRRLIKDNCSNADYRSLFSSVEKTDDNNSDNQDEKNTTNSKVEKKKKAKRISYYLYIKSPKNCSIKELTDYIDIICKKYNLDDNKDYKYYTEQKDMGNFLPKINSIQNANYPFQLNLIELQQIINNQKKYYPCLDDRTMDGTNKIEKLLTFRIPYYVGPLNLNKDPITGESRSNAWIVKNSNEKITPWNFNEVVNIDASAEKFITRMTNFCTYLYKEKVIPKHSLLYSRFTTLNEIKQITINGKRLSLEEQHKLFRDLFLGEHIGTVTVAQLLRWLQINGITNDDKPELRGFQAPSGFASNMKAYQEFTSIFGQIDDSNIEMIERLIELITIFEDKTILRRRVEFEYKELTKEQVDKIVRLKYTGWSSLSRKLLMGLSLVNKKTGEVNNIMDLMENTKANFMQIINDTDLNFQSLINKENNSVQMDEITYEDVKELATSPANKKGIWQAIQLVKEIVHLNEKKPKHIFIEMARSEEEKVAKNSREFQLKKLYEKLKKDIKSDEQLFASNNDIKNKEDEIKSCELLNTRKYYLYFLQNGKSLYTGRPININDMDAYEVDHIIPRSVIKNDSYDNLALVEKEQNQLKGDSLTLDINIINTQKKYWKFLQRHGFMSMVKYNNLCRINFSDEDINGFIKRQLVETRQITKHVVALLNNIYGEGVVVPIRQNIVHDFREKYSVVKIRNLNDLHHAEDAYLNACMGQYLVRKYPDFQNKGFSIHREKINNGKFGAIFDDMENDDKLELNKLVDIATILKMVSYKDALVTKKVETCSGAFYNETIYGKKSANAKIPLKDGMNFKKYGGRTNMYNAYWCFIQYNKGKTVEKLLVAIPIVISEKSKDKEEYIIEYLEKEKKYKNVKILKNHVKKYQLIKYNGQLCYLASNTEVHNAVQLKISEKYKQLLSDVLSGTKLMLRTSDIKDKSDEEKVAYMESIKIKKQELIDEFIGYLVNKIITNYPLFNNEGIFLKNFIDSDKYLNITYNQKEIFIREIVKMLGCNASLANLAFLSSDFEGKKRFGRKSGIGICELVVINTSITGLNRRTYEF